MDRKKYKIENNIRNNIIFKKEQTFFANLIKHYTYILCKFNKTSYTPTQTHAAHTEHDIYKRNFF